MTGLSCASESKNQQPIMVGHNHISTMHVCIAINKCNSIHRKPVNRFQTDVISLWSGLTALSPWT